MAADKEQIQFCFIFVDIEEKLDIISHLLEILQNALVWSAVCSRQNTVADNGGSLFKIKT